MSAPCSPKDQIGGIIYLPRLCDKIRLFEKGELPEDYHANLGHGMDRWTCEFLGVNYEDLAAEVRKGATDDEILEWCQDNGKSRPDYEYEWWVSYMTNRGFRDDLSERLAERKQEAGWADRNDIQSFMDYLDADEGR